MEILTAMVEGIRFALCPICFVVFAALYTYGVTIESGAMEQIKKGLAGVSKDQRVLALLIAWGFSNFMEGMAGFGTAVAIPAAILVGIGFDPLKAVLMCLVANTTPTAFGSVGVPLMTLAKETNTDLASLSWTTALLQAFVTTLGPILVLLVLDGWRGLKGMGGYILLAAFGFLIPWLLTAKFLGCELPDILGAVVVMVVISLAAKKESTLDLGTQLFAWLPFGFVVVILGVSAFLPPVVKQYTTPGALVLVAGFAGGLVQKLSVRHLVVLLWKTLSRYYKAFLKICVILAVARGLVALGLIGAIANFLVSATGAAYPFFATLVGALGGFVTGSGTNSCVLFGRLQVDAALALQVAPEILAAANVMGAGIGKMICPQSIAIGAAAASLAGAAEGQLFRKALPWFLGVVCLAGLITGFVTKFFYSL